MGQVLQLSASITVASGGQKDATHLVSWQSSNAEIASTSQSGLLTAQGPGEADVTAAFETLTAVAHVSVNAHVVVPSPLFNVSGLVHEPPPTADAMVSGVRIEVDGGPLAAQVFATDSRGRFALPPIATGNFYLYFKKLGYEDANFWVKDLPRDETIDTEIVPERRTVRLSLSGSDSCHAPAPDRECHSWDGRCIPKKEFDVYHDGLLIVEDVMQPLPFWGKPGLVLCEWDNRGRDWRCSDDEMGLGFPAIVKAGVRYKVEFSGDLNMCDPYRLVWSHTR